jgi:hypothetical protein
MGSENISLGSVKDSAVVKNSSVQGEVDAGAYVDAKYMGTRADQHEMRALGRTQVLRVRIASRPTCRPPSH